MHTFTNRNEKNEKKINRDEKVEKKLNKALAKY